MRTARLPEGYVAVRSRDADAFAWAAAAAWLADLLQAGETLHGWAERVAVERRMGRGPVLVVPAPVPGPDGHAHWAVRHYRRGGAVARVLADRYLSVGPRRPLLELRASALARARGVPVPASVAGAAHPAGALGALYRADLATELIPGARTLADALRAPPPGWDSSAALVKVGRLVRTLEAAGVSHADLNATNVALDDAGAAWTLDLDRCRVLSDGRPGPGSAMMARLERSLRKLAVERGRPLPAEAWSSLRAGFAETS